ncbi:MAG: pilus assembly protein [Chloroflexota bacterium]|nr:pilus assembly protein [Chloroflexota bacterium]
MVEFALVLVLLLLIIFGFLQFGIAMNAKIDSTHLTAEGARYIAVNQNPGDPETLQNYIRSTADTADLRDTAAVCVEYPTNPETSTAAKIGDPVRVTMSYSYDDLIPLVGDAVGGLASLVVTSEATMRLEALPTKIAAGCTT